MTAAIIYHYNFIIVYCLIQNAIKASRQFMLSIIIDRNNNTQ